MGLTEPYKFDPGFEKAVVSLSCLSKTFYGKIGHVLEPEALSGEIPKLALEAVQAVANGSGVAPGSGVIVIQRLKRWMHEGKVTMEQIRNVNNYLEQAEVSGIPDEQAVLSELVPVLKRRMQMQAARMAFEDYNQHGNFERVTEMIDAASRLGKADEFSAGISLDDAGFDAIKLAQTTARLPTGIKPLDTALGGGLLRGSLGIVMGPAGRGKSIFLSHVAANTLRLRKTVLLATLELGEHIQLARIMANLTGVPTEAILDGTMYDDAKRKLSALKLGHLVIKYFEPLITTVDDINIWVERYERTNGKEPPVLVVDYGDRIGATRAKKEYDTGLIVFEGLRSMATSRNGYMWTASQSQRLNRESSKRLDMDHVADSMHKPRIADTFITLNSHDNGHTIEYFVGKHRLGSSRMTVGPLPTEFELGRMAPVDDYSDSEVGVL